MSCLYLIFHNDGNLSETGPVRKSYDMQILISHQDIKQNKRLVPYTYLNACIIYKVEKGS